MTALTLSPDENDLRKFILAINQYAQGRSNAGKTFACALNSATTTVIDANVGAGSMIAICPTNAASSAEFLSGNLWVAPATIKAGSFVVSHTNSATAGRLFMYVIQG